MSTEKTPKPFLHSSSYGWGVYSPKEFKNYMQKCLKKIVSLQKHLGFEGIAFSGNSGSSLGILAYYEHGIFPLYVRKLGEKHHGSLIEGFSPKSGIRKYLIVDDLIATGSTIRVMMRQIHREARMNEQDIPECVGIFLYQSGDMFDRTFDAMNSIYKRNIPIFSKDTPLDRYSGKTKKNKYP